MGNTLSNDLTWKRHVDNIVKKAGKIIYSLYQINNNNNKHIYFQPHRVGFTYTVIYKQNKIQGNKMRRNVIRKVIHTATQRDTQSDTYTFISNNILTLYKMSF